MSEIDQYFDALQCVYIAAPRIVGLSHTGQAFANGVERVTQAGCQSGCRQRVGDIVSRVTI